MDLKYYIDLYKESGYIIELRKYIQYFSIK